MPIESRWDDDERTWVLTPGETFELAEVLDLLRDTEWKGARRYLWDLRALAEGPGTTGDLRRMLDESERLSAQWNGSRVAIVATADLHYGVARMFTAFASDLDIEYRVFRDELEARAWLRS